MQPFGTAKPNIARVWDYWLGGNDNFAADRTLADPRLPARGWSGDAPVPDLEPRQGTFLAGVGRERA